MQYSTLFKLYKPQLASFFLRAVGEYSTLFKLYKPQRNSLQRIFSNKNRRQAEHPPRSGYHTHVARQRNDMRHSSDVVLPNKKPPSGGTPAAKRLPHACRAQARRLAQPPATQFPNHADSGRRDDRAMMTQGCAGRRELPFTSFPAYPKSGRTNARRSLSAISACLQSALRQSEIAP